MSAYFYFSIFAVFGLIVDQLYLDPISLTQDQLSQPEWHFNHSSMLKYQKCFQLNSTFVHWGQLEEQII